MNVIFARNVTAYVQDIDASVSTCACLYVFVACAVRCGVTYREKLMVSAHDGLDRHMTQQTKNNEETDVIWRSDIEYFVWGLMAIREFVRG